MADYEKFDVSKINIWAVVIIGICLAAVIWFGVSIKIDMNNNTIEINKISESIKKIDTQYTNYLKTLPIEIQQKLLETPKNE